MPLPAEEIVLRLLVTFVFSMAFGIERQLRKKPVSFGTFTLVAIGSCVLTIVTIEFADSPLFAIGGIITGIGFLGAGALLKQNDKVFGFTTAASIWAFAAFGIAVGTGEFFAAMVFYTLIVAVVLVDNYFEKMGFGRYAKIVTLTVSRRELTSRVRRLLPPRNSYLNSSYDIAKKEFTQTFFVNGTKKEIEAIPTRLANARGIKSFRID